MVHGGCNIELCLVCNKPVAEGHGLKVTDRCSKTVDGVCCSDGCVNTWEKKEDDWQQCPPRTPSDALHNVMRHTGLDATEEAKLDMYCA